jgi:hypothetical protein
MKRLCRYCTIGLVCACCVQGVKTPPASFVGHVFTATAVSGSTATMTTTTVPNRVTGKVIDLPRVTHVSQVVIPDIEVVPIRHERR